MIMELFAHVATYSRDHNEHITSQLANTNMASDFHSVLHDNNNKLERLTCQSDKQSQELVNVTEQLCRAQLIMEDK